MSRYSADYGALLPEIERELLTPPKARNISAITRLYFDLDELCIRKGSLVLS